MSVIREDGRATLIDVLDRVLDKGIVIDAWVRVSLAGLDLLMLEARVVITTPPGDDAQVDYGSCPMMGDPQAGKYRHTRLFVRTLGYSRKSVRLLAFRSSTRVWAELYENGFRSARRCATCCRSR